MSVASVGLDAVELARIASVLEKRSERFLARVYTPAEQELAATRPHRVQFFAGRFAAKEAVLKVIGTGWGAGVAFTDVEVLRQPSGAPRVTLSGPALARADELGIGAIHVSISHTDRDAYAVAVAERA